MIFFAGRSLRLSKRVCLRRRLGDPTDARVYVDLRPSRRMWAAGAHERLCDPPRRTAHARSARLPAAHSLTTRLQILGESFQAWEGLPILRPIRGALAADDVFEARHRKPAVDQHRSL